MTDEDMHPFAAPLIEPRRRSLTYDVIVPALLVAGDALTLAGRAFGCLADHLAPMPESSDEPIRVVGRAR
jgi:hypothetical protein